MSRFNTSAQAVPEKLFGRERTLASLHQFLASAATSGHALLLVGEPGVGKTALLDTAVVNAQAAGFLVIRAVGIEFETDASYAGLHRLLAPVLDHLGDLSLVHRRALAAALGVAEGQAGDRLLIASAALALVNSAARTQPLLLVIDDTPWVDRASAVILGFLARRLGGTRVSLLAAQRLDEDSYFDSGGLTALEVAPIEHRDADHLLAVHFPDLAPLVRKQLVTEARGNPLALLELPRDLSDAQRLAQETLPDVFPVSRRVQSVFATRVAALSPATRTALLMAALDTTGALDGIDELGSAERARLVTISVSGQRIEFAHPLIRSAVVQAATNDERRAAHRALAQRPHLDADAVARHRADALSGPDEIVAGLLEETAFRVLRRGDATGSVTMLLRAAELSPAKKDRARRLSHAAYVGSDVVGSLQNVSALLAEARRSDPNPSASLTSAIATAHVLLNGDGDIDTAHDLLVGAINRIEPGGAAAVAVEEALQTLLLVCHYGGRSELWEPFEAALLRFADDISPILKVTAVSFGDPVRCTPSILSTLDAMLVDLGQETDPIRVNRVSVAAFFIDRLGPCRTALLRSAEIGRRGGAQTSALYALQQTAADDFLSARYDDFGSRAREVLALCAENGYVLLSWPGKYSLALIAAIQGDADLLEEFATEMTRWARPRRAFRMEIYATHARAIAMLGTGEFEGAFSAFSMINAPGGFASHEPFGLWTIMDLVEAAVRSGRLDEAVMHVAAAQTAGVAAISPRIAFLCAAAVALTAPPDRADELFEQALSDHSSHDWPFERARLQLAWGESLRRQRKMAASRQHLTAALDSFARMGATPWAVRSQAQLKSSGVAKPVALAAGRRQLTLQESEIASLAASGLTNRQIGERLFLSHRTVGAHLYRIFPKLGITARASLRDALATPPL